MKKTAGLICLIFAFGLITPISANAGGGKFEGVISYSITFPNSTLPAEQLAMFPKAMTLTVKGTNTRNESVSAMGNMVEITNFDKKFTVSLLNMMGKKLAIRKTLDEINQDISKEPKPSVQITNETKDISGYKCKKAVVTIEKNGKKNSFEIWYTNELGGREVNFGNPVYQDIDGMLMEFTFQERTLSMKYTVTKVEKKAVLDSSFEIPSDYTLTTEAELKNMFGGGM
ncbi:MAG: hypothetical protein NTY96_00845 [Bacteroidetes bacterium]|nr:hypothetical protein [Bacteroidota bacterium]